MRMVIIVQRKRMQPQKKTVVELMYNVENALFSVEIDNFSLISVCHIHAWKIQLR